MLKELKEAMSSLTSPLSEEKADHLLDLLEKHSHTQCRYASSMLDDIQLFLDKEATQEDDFSEEIKEELRLTILEDLDKLIKEYEEEIRE